MRFLPLCGVSVAFSNHIHNKIFKSSYITKRFVDFKHEGMNFREGKMVTLLGKKDLSANKNLVTIEVDKPIIMPNVVA